MQLWLWVAFFVVSNLLGVEVFKAAVTLPWDEALVPGLLTLPLVGLSALGATRIGTSRTREILDECRRRLGLEPISAPGLPSSGKGY